MILKLRYVPIRDRDRPPSSSLARACNNLLQSLPISNLEILQLDQMGEPRNGPVQQELQKRSGILSVPQVFFNGEFIGENSDIQQMNKENQLASKLGLE